MESGRVWKWKHGDFSITDAGHDYGGQLNWKAYQIEYDNKDKHDYHKGRITMRNEKPYILYDDTDPEKPPNLC